MSFRVVPYRAWHLDALIAGSVQPAQRRSVSHVPAGIGKVYEMPGLALTALDGDHVLMVGGVLPLTLRMGSLWAVLAEDAGAHMLRLHRGTLRFLEIGKWRRLEATVEVGFGAGCRWLELLGFTLESPRVSYGDNGEDHLAYVKVQR